MQKSAPVFLSLCLCNALASADSAPSPELASEEIRQAQTYLDEHRYKNAEALLSKLLESAPRAFDVRLLSARLFRETGQLEKASDEYAKAAELDEENLEPLLALAEISLQEMQLDLGLSYAQQAVSRDPSSSRARFILIDALLRCDRSGEAERQIKLLPKESSGSFEYESLAYRLSLKKGDLFGARNHLQRAIQANRGKSLKLILEEAELMQSMSEFARAKEILTRIVSEHPDYLEARLQLARLLESQFHDYAQSLVNYEEALRQDPLSVQAAAGKERCSLKRRNIALQLKTALREWWQSISQDPGLWPRLW